MRRSRNWTRIARRIAMHPATLLTAVRVIQRVAGRSGSSSSDDFIDQALDMAGLKRKPGTASQIGSALPWLTAGAALGAGALMASPAARPMVDDAMKQLAGLASDGWDQSADFADSLRSGAIAASDTALAQVGLQRRPSFGSRVFRTGAWIGVGVATGYAVSMYAKMSPARAEREDNEARNVSEAGGNSHARGTMTGDAGVHPG